MLRPLESLEPRRLLAAAAVVTATFRDGVVEVMGTAGADAISVSTGPLGGITIQSGADFVPFDTGGQQVTGILVLGGGRADEIDVYLDANDVNVTVCGHSGNDKVEAAVYAAARDQDGMRKIKGFNVFVRAWDPSEIKGMILASINQPIRIGRAIVLPGDVILAKRTGVVVIPAHLAETVVVTAEIIHLKDEFGHLRLREGVYTPGQIDVKWTDPIKADFFKWLKARKDNPPIPFEVIEKHL